MHWTFGDGGVQNGSATISHAYRSAGSYTASLAVDLPGGTTRSAPVGVRLVSWARSVRLQAGPAGSRRFTAVIHAPAGCRAGDYQLVRRGATHRVVSHGRLGAATLYLTAPAAGRYQLALPALARPGGTCAAATSASATIRPAPVHHDSGTSAPATTTQTQPPVHYTPPAPR